MALWEQVAKLEDVPDAGMIEVAAQGEPVALYRVGDRLYATHAHCTHEQTSLADGEFEAEDLEVECPLHGSRFNVETGAVRILPATKPVKVYEVKVEDGLVYVGPEKELSATDG